MPKEPGVVPKSRSQRKREVLALQKLGERLLDLTPEQLQRLELPPELMEAVVFARGLKKHGARRRQLQYIGALMRDIDPQPIQDFLEDIAQGRRTRTATFRQAEQWRDALCAGDDLPLDEILGRWPASDHKRLHQLVRNARNDRTTSQAARSARLLFRFLRDLLESEEA